MKKIILLLLSFISLSVSAQLQKSVLFDFSKPTELSPSITPSTISGGIVQVSSTTFKNKQVSINFTQGSQPTGAQIFTYKNPYSGEVSYSLKITATTTMTIAVSDGAVLDSLRISPLSSIGDLHLVYGEPGSQDPNQEYKFWMSDTKDCSEVSFYNNSQASQLRQLYIYYTTPSELLVPVSCSINPDEVLPSLKEFTLTFESNMTVQDASAIQCVSTAGNERTVNAKTNGKNVTLSLNQAIATDDEVTVIIPAKCFKDNEGFENKELTYTFKIVEPRNSLQYTSVTPAAGETEKLTNTINITFGESVKLSSADAIVLCKNNKALYPMSISVSKADDKVIVLTHEHEVIEDEGNYTLTIPEGRIHNAFYQAQGVENLDRYNAEIKLEYTIKAVVPQPHEDSETMKAAKELLGKTGVGYPAENSNARKALAALTTSETVPSDRELSNAIDAFYAENNIMLPVSDKYYKVSAVNSDNSRLYLSYKDGSVTLSSNAMEAAAFKATQNSDKTIVLHTNDGKYLHVLVSDNSHQGTTDKNVTEQCTADINHLRIAKLTIENKTKEAFGLVSIYGSLGKDEVLGTSENAYALINHETDRIITSSKYTDLYFESKLSSAFMFEETDEHAGVTPIEITGTLTPETAKSNSDVLTLTLSGAEAYTLVNPSVVYFTDKSGARITTESQNAILSAVEGSSNQYSVHLDNLADGEYQLVIPEGVFNCESKGKTGVSTEIKLSFTIQTEAEVDFDYSFHTFSYLQDKGVETPVTDESLNEMVLFIMTGYSDMIPDETKEVRLAYYDNNTTIRTGHFVSYPDIVKEGFSGAHAIKLVLDAPIKKGELRSGKYTWVIPEATFGDANFGKWLKDHNSIEKNECVVNPFETLSVHVDNKAATGINSIYTDNGDTVIYDLTGRRLKKISKSGLYIVNGKKVFIKR